MFTNYVKSRNVEIRPEQTGDNKKHIPHSKRDVNDYRVFEECHSPCTLDGWG
jgi:hypothetical protein